jgi:hypothetical protein
MFRPADVMNNSTSDFLLLAGYVMYHAKECEAVDQRSPFDILRELNRLGHDTFRVFSSKHWTSAYQRAQPRQGVERYDSDFLTYATEFDLQLYVRNALEEDPRVRKNSTLAKLMASATDRTLRHPMIPPDERKVHGMIKLLMDFGADLAPKKQDTSSNLPVKRNKSRYEFTAELPVVERQLAVTQLTLADDGASLLGSNPGAMSFLDEANSEHPEPEFPGTLASSSQRSNANTAVGLVAAPRTKSRGSKEWHFDFDTWRAW